MTGNRTSSSTGSCSGANRAVSQNSVLFTFIADGGQIARKSPKTADFSANWLPESGRHPGFGRLWKYAWNFGHPACRSANAFRTPPRTRQNRVWPKQDQKHLPSGASESGPPEEDLWMSTENPAGAEPSATSSRRSASRNNHQNSPGTPLQRPAQPRLRSHRRGPWPAHRQNPFRVSAHRYSCR